MTLGDVCEEAIGTRDHQAEPDRTFRYVDITSVDNRKKRIIEARTLRGLDAPSRARQVIRANDVLVSTTRPNLNAVAIVPTDLDDEICSTGFCVLRARSELLPDFLFAWVRHEGFVAALSDLVKGALYPAVTDGQVRAQCIPLPPLPEQKLIADVLTEQMAAVELARAAAQAQLDDAKALPAAILRRAFPVAGLELPDGWQWLRLGDVCEFVRGVTFDKADVRMMPMPDHVPVLRAGNIGNGLDLENDLVWVPSHVVSPDQELRQGDIVICMSSGSASVVGKSAPLTVRWKGSVGAFCGILRSRESRHSQYCSLWLRSPGFVSWRDAQARGANIQNLRFSQLADLELPFPPSAEMRGLATELSEDMSAVERLVSALKGRLAEIDALPAALLNQAFTGGL